MRAIGIDISRWQAPEDLNKPHGIDFKKMHEAADFIIVRAGFGGSAGGAWVDPRVHEYMSELAYLLEQNPLPFTFYWYFRDDVSVIDQVNRFAEVVNRWKFVVNLPLVVDAEVFVKSDAVSTQKIIDFQTEVEKQTGLLVDILYARAWQLNDETTPGLPVVLPFLFIARYSTELDPQYDEPWGNPGDSDNIIPRDYDTWTIWQHTSECPGEKYGVTANTVDECVAHMTVEEMRSWAKLDVPNPPPGGQYGVNADFQKFQVEGAQGVLVFEKDVPTEMKIVQLGFPEGEVARVRLYYVVDEVTFRVKTYKTLERGGVLYYPPKLTLKAGDYFFATLDIAEGFSPKVSMKVMYEDW
jgi:GH25 family lysozyme M1 (1,4-beta-N-acetylmuramidase)